MAEITDRESLERWLKGRPREDAVVIAVRAALRAVPMLERYDSGPFSKGMSASTTDCIGIFRALSVVWATRAFNLDSSGMDERVRRAGFALGDTSGANEVAAASLASASSSIAHGAVYLRRAIHALFSAQLAMVSDDPNSAAHAAVIEVDGLFPGGLVGADADRYAIEKGISARELAMSPLWQGPIWKLFHGRDFSLSPRWDAIKERLLATDEDWHVWTDWYEDRLHGRPANEALELARVLEITEEDWKAGPRFVNAKIARLIEEHAPKRPEVSQTSPVSVIAAAVARQPRTVALGAADLHDRVAAWIDQRRASLPNEPDALARTQEEIALFEQVLGKLASVSDAASTLPALAEPQDAEPVAREIVDLATRFERCVAVVIGKERAPGVVDMLLIGAMSSFLIGVCDAPPFMAFPASVGAIAGRKLTQRLTKIAKAWRSTGE